jgi:hypothetical protein
MLISVPLSKLDYMISAHTAQDYLSLKLHYIFNSQYNCTVQLHSVGNRVGFLIVTIANLNHEAQHNATTYLKFKMSLLDAACVQSAVKNDFEFKCVSMSKRVAQLNLKSYSFRAASPLASAILLARWLCYSQRALKSMR